MYPHEKPPYNAVKAHYVGHETIKDIDVKITYKDNNGELKQTKVREFFQQPDMIWNQFEADTLTPNQIVYFRLLQKKSVPSKKVTLSVSFTGTQYRKRLTIEKEFELQL